MSKNFLPESMYDIDSRMTPFKLFNHYLTKKSIIGKVIRIDSKTNTIKVNVGGNLTANMSFDEATIYPIYRPNGTLSPNIYTLLDKTIQAKVIGLDVKNIRLSRKNNMLEALDSLKTQSEIPYAVITNFFNISAFVDIGAGLVGRIKSKELSNVMFRNIADIGLAKGDIIPVKVLNFFQDSNNFELSRVATFPNFRDIIKKGEIVHCKVFGNVGDPQGLGYFVLIKDTVCGILDSQVILNYGNEVVAKVSKLGHKGPHLDLVKKL